MIVLKYLRVKIDYKRNLDEYIKALCMKAKNAGEQLLNAFSYKLLSTSVNILQFYQ